MNLDPLENLANPYQVPNSDEYLVTDQGVVDKPIRLLFHPMNIVLLIGYSFVLWVSSGNGWVLPISALLLTVFAGILGHFVYKFLIRARFIVPIVVLLIVNTALQALFLARSGSLNLRLMAELPLLIPGSIRFTPLSSSVIFVLGVVFSVGIFMLAHPIRPNLRNALVSAMAIVAWYATSLMILNYAG